MVALLTALTSTAIARQQRFDREILTRAAAALELEEPTWRYGGGICTCPRLIEEQEAMSLGTWTRRKGRRDLDVAMVMVYQISNAEAAARWIAGFGAGRHADGWTVARYDLGDEGYLGTAEGGSRSTITFRKGRTIATVSGPSVRDLDRVARHLLRQM